MTKRQVAFWQHVAPHRQRIIKAANEDGPLVRRLIVIRLPTEVRIPPRNGSLGALAWYTTTVIVYRDEQGQLFGREENPSFYSRKGRTVPAFRQIA